MSGTVDDRVVGIKFDNASFEKGAATSMSTLEKLKSSFNLSNATSAATKSLGVISSTFGKFGLTNPFARSTQGVADLQGQTNRFSMAPMVTGVAGVSKSFIALSTVAITALSNIVNKAVDSGLAFAKSFTVAPILDGLKEYETNLKSVQTIQANTDRPLTEINASLDELNRYSDLTIYNFSEMAKNIGTFTAAGVDLQTATSSIKGIANLAALSGSSSQQAATAMYQLSQAISSGRVGLQDWNSVVNAGMGGKKLQNALAQTAIAMGEIDKTAVKMVGPMDKLTINGGSFRESIMAKPGETPWLTSDILVNTLATMDGRFSAVALAAEETDTGLRKYTDAQIKAKIATSRTALETKNGVKYTNEQFAALQQMSTSAFEAATKVKTLGQVFDVAKETLASGWSASFRNLFGGLNQAKALFTGMSNGLNDIIKDNARARNLVLTAWAEGGGRASMIQGLKKAWEALLKIAQPIKNAFREIFPPKTGQDLIHMSRLFKRFAESMIPSGETMNTIRKIFTGVFSLFSIGIQIVKGIAGVIFDLFASMSNGSGKLVDFVVKIAEFITGIDQAMKSGDGLKNFFDGLTRVLKIPLGIIGRLASAIGSIFTGFDFGGGDKLSGSLDGVKETLSPLQRIGKVVSDVFSRIGEVFGNVGQTIGKALGNMGPAIADAFGSDSFGQILSTINTALLGGIVYMVRNFFNNAGDQMTGGFFKNIQTTLGSVTDTLGIMQTNIKSNIILKIAGALLLLAGAIAIIAMLDPKKVLFAMGVLAASFYGMQAALVALTTALGVIGAAKLPLIGAGLVLVATSLVIFAGALALMGAIPFDNMVRGLLGFAGVLFIMKKFVESLDNKGIVRSAIAMGILGVAMNLMAVALKIFASMSWEEMARGLTALAGTLVVLAGAMRLMPKGMIAQAAALLILSVALNAMATALLIFATLSWDQMARGLTALAGALVIIAAAMRLMPKNMLLQSIALNAVATAITVLAGALKIMGGMSWDEIGKGLAALGGAMLILAIALKVMTGTLSGAAALIIAAAALAIITPVLVTLGGLSWEAIAKGLTALAAVFVILGVAGYVLGPMIPVILGLGAALLMIGGGLALAGAAFLLVSTGVLALATAFGIITGVGIAGVAVLADIIGTFIAAIPAFLTSFAKGLGAFAQEISKHGPSFTNAMATIMTSMLNAIIRNAPKAAKAFLAMLRAALTVIVNATPMIVTAGLNLIIRFLEGIASKIGKITTLAIDIVVNFINAIASRIDKVIQAGVNLLISFLEGIAKALNDPTNQTRLTEAGKAIGKAIIDGALSGLSAGKDLIIQAAQNVGGIALTAIKKILGINSPSKEFAKIGVFVNEGFVAGLKGSEADVIAVMDELGADIKASAESTASEIESLTGNLKDLRKAKRDALKDKNKKNDDKYDKDIKKGKIALTAAQTEQELVKATRKMMQGEEYKKQATELRTLGQEHDRNAEAIEKYKTQLAELTQYRDSIASKFNTTPDIAKNTSLASYNRNAEKEKAKVTEFNGDLQALLAMGLDKESYNKLLEEGLDAQPFIDKLIAAGPSAVEAFDQSNAGLALAAVGLGNNATVAMYGVGVQTVQGLLDGLNSRQNEIELAMTLLGAKMVEAIKRKLKIQSPSKAFMEVGKHSNAGLAKGLKAYSGVVKDAAGGVGEDALHSLQKSMRKAKNSLPVDEFNMSPVIAPVLDLTQLQKEATKIGGMLPESSVVGQVSYQAAAAISEEAQGGSASAAGSVAASAEALSYTQNIYTTDRPSEVAIFRGTRSQLAMKKEELKLNNDRL